MGWVCTPILTFPPSRGKGGGGMGPRMREDNGRGGRGTTEGVGPRIREDKEGRKPPIRGRMLLGTGVTPIPRLHEGRL